MMTRWLSFASALALASAPVAAFAQDTIQAPLNDPYRLFQAEQFRAEGDEPYFWTVGIESDLAHEASAAGSRFELLMTKFDAILGGQPPLEAVLLPEGVDTIAMRRDAATRHVTLEGEEAAARFLNQLLDDLGDGPRRGSWSEAVLAFDETLIPALPPTRVETSFRIEKLPVRREVYDLITFETAEFPLRVGEAEVRTRYDGFVLVDERRELLYHGVFRQRGSVEHIGRASEFEHLTALVLTDFSDEPLVPVRSSKRLNELASSYDFHGQSANPDVSPSLREQHEKPPWVTAIWLAGRYANMSLGAAAERNSNPVPLLSISSVAMTDASIEFAGNIYLDRADIAAGKKSSEAYDPHDGEFESPLQHGRAPRAGEEASESKRLLPLTPNTRASVRIGGEVIAVGLVFATAEALFVNASSSTIGFAAEANAVTSYATVVATPATAAVGGGIATAAAILGTGAGAAVLDDNNGSAASPFEGSWNGIFKTNCESGTFSWTVDIAGNITGNLNSGESSVTFTGSVSNQGVMTGTTTTFVDYLFSGEFRARKASGTISDITFDGECAGSWSATLQGLSGPEKRQARVRERKPR